MENDLLAPSIALISVVSLIFFVVCTIAILSFLMHSSFILSVKEISAKIVERKNIKEEVWMSELNECCKTCSWRGFICKEETTGENLYTCFCVGSSGYMRKITDDDFCNDYTSAAEENF